MVEYAITIGSRYLSVTCSTSSLTAMNPLQKFFPSSAWIHSFTFSIIFCKNLLLTEPVLVMQKSLKYACPWTRFLKSRSILQQQRRDQVNH